jgi:fatty-acyl-CoA synthase
LAPSSVNERRHELRLAVGNGLQEAIWRTFQERFAVPQILEYYAATEGVMSLYNCEGKPGAIGYIPPVLEPYFAVKLLQIDLETGEPKRGPDGLCCESARGEPGEAVTLLRAERRFDGYNDTEASNRKILRNVCVDGDTWFRTGDLMRQDAAGYYYFVDRMGDTFRWKGENVSTTEVANVIRQCPGVIDAIVYGVSVAGNEGRAGMTAIVPADGFSLETFAAHIDQQLPSFARPLFVRVCESLDATATFKLTKSRFATESYSKSSDPVYIRRDGHFVIAEAV